MVDHTHYTYRTAWSVEDDEYVATCAEFPSLSYLDETPVKALDGLMTVVKDVVADMTKNEEAIPEPLMTRHYSGKFVVRVPSEIHRELAIKAAEQGTSLNAYIASQLH